VAYAAFFFSVVGLAFTVLAFWWLNAREGTLHAPEPAAYAFAVIGRLRLPLAIFNSGAKDLIVADLRLVLDGERTLRWVTTRSLLRPEEHDGFAYATPFAVRGRGTRELIAEFEGAPWRPERERYTVALEARQDSEWRQIGSFDWWTPLFTEETKNSYVTYRNERLATTTHQNHSPSDT
jgi:hypothetical protein